MILPILFSLCKSWSCTHIGGGAHFHREFKVDFFNSSNGFNYIELYNLIEANLTLHITGVNPRFGKSPISSSVYIRDTGSACAFFGQYDASLTLKSATVEPYFYHIFKCDSIEYPYLKTGDQFGNGLSPPAHVIFSNSDGQSQEMEPREPSDEYTFEPQRPARRIPHRYRYIILSIIEAILIIVVISIIIIAIAACIRRMMAHRTYELEATPAAAEQYTHLPQSGPQYPPFYQQPMNYYPSTQARAYYRPQ